MNLTVAAVLRSGGPYKPQDVQRLARAVERQLPNFERFTCIADQPIEGVETIQMEHLWPGFWSKIELFRPDLFASTDRVLYLDLDTVILGSLEEIAGRTEPFVGIKDFYRQPPRCAPQFASGLMLWTPNEGSTHQIYLQFLTEDHRRLGINYRFGDQEWISHFIRPVFWQDVLPGQVVSYKVDCMRKGAPPEGARVVCFHGQPRPFQVYENWVREYWNESVPA